MWDGDYGPWGKSDLTGLVSCPLGVRVNPGLGVCVWGEGSQGGKPLGGVGVSHTCRGYKALVGCASLEVRDHISKGGAAHHG